MPAEATVALLRVAQEALVNAAKHGAGKPVTVRLDFDAAWVRLTVRNELDAVAAPCRGAEHRQRRLRPDRDAGTAAAARGTLEAGRDGTGWVVTAQVPLSAAN